MRATSCNWGSWRPWVLSMRRACMEEAHLSGSPWLGWNRLRRPGPAGSPPELPRQDGITQGVKSRSFPIDDTFPSLRGVEAEVVRSRPLLDVIELFHC